VLQCTHCKQPFALTEAILSYALFFKDTQISEVFANKAEAWAFAEKCGHVIVVAARDEDPPRRMLGLSHSIRQVAVPPVFSLSETLPRQRLGE
jgi:hypothetical protein